MDGYLYVFHTEGNGEPQMIFPDSSLNSGRNSISSHVPYEVPSSLDPNPDLRWFTFYSTPAIEHVYIVVTRQPLQNVPIAEKLVGYCKTAPKDCPWKPSGALWAQLKSKSQAKLSTSKSRSQGEAQSSIEQESVGRALGMTKDAPPPSVINMSASSETETLITLINLIHK